MEVRYSQLRVMCRCSLQTTLGEGLINLGHLHMEEKLIILLVCFRPHQKTRRESPLLELRFVPRLSGEGCYYVNLPRLFPTPSSHGPQLQALDRSVPRRKL